MKKSALLYALTLAAMLLVLRAIEYRYLVYDLREEYLVGFLAVLFTTLGIWMGWKLTYRPRQNVLSVPLLTPGTPASSVGITPREAEVLRLIAAGHSNQEIADRLFLSLNTVKKHTSSLFRKLEAERRTQAIEKARQLGLLG